MCPSLDRRANLGYFHQIFTEPQLIVSGIVWAKILIVLGQHRTQGNKNLCGKPNHNICNQMAHLLFVFSMRACFDYCSAGSNGMQRFLWFTFRNSRTHIW